MVWKGSGKEKTACREPPCISVWCTVYWPYYCVWIAEYLVCYYPSLFCVVYFLWCLLSKRSPWCWLRQRKLVLSMVLSSLFLFQLVLAELQLTVLAFVGSVFCATSSVSSWVHAICSANAAGLGRWCSLSCLVTPYSKQIQCLSQIINCKLPLWIHFLNPQEQPFFIPT